MTAAVVLLWIAAALFAWLLVGLAAAFIFGRWVRRKP